MKPELLAGMLCCIPTLLSAATRPTAGLVNYETAHVHPIDLTPDRQTLLAVNIAAHRLEVWTVSSGIPVWRGYVRTGLDPVTVRARSNAEAWVVNQVSDSVSVVNLQTLTVTGTLNTDNEPADVVFANGRAFVSCADANSVNVFTLSNLAQAPQKIAIAGEEPRALEVSADGTRVYAAIFESGNGSTTVSGGESVLAGNAVSRSDSPYGGKNPPPNRGNLYDPPFAAGVLKPVQGLIVKKDAQGRWMDDNNGNWSPFISGSLASASGRVAGWDVADNDVAIIDSNSLAVSYQKRLMNICMAIAVNPANGQVSVVGTEGTNEVRWEPNLNGRFIRVNHASFTPGSTSVIRDLNPHLTYTASSIPQAQRSQSLGDPRGVAWRQNGQRLFVTGMGSNNIAVMDAAGARVGTFAVGQGPTGLVLDDAAGRGFVLNKFDGTVSVIDLNAMSEIRRVAFDDPTPAVIKEGRPFLYNTHLTSGTGHVSCASCHVDAKTDRLAWDLGDPRGPNVNVAAASNSNGALTGGQTAVSSMKGPMLTQTLQDIMAHPNLHWRGDKANLTGFSGAFVNLMGADAPVSTADMQKFGAFLNTIHLPPNPYRRIDDSRPNSVQLPDGSWVTSTSMNSLRGTNSRGNNCIGCHMGQGTATRNRGANSELQQAFVAPAWSPFYKRLGFWPKSAGISTSGFGFFHDGADSLAAAARMTQAESQPDMLAELLTLDGPTGPLRNGEVRQDTHAGVGKQLTLSGAVTSAQQTFLDQMVSIANSSAFAALVAHGKVNGASRAFQLSSGTSFLSDRAAQSFTLAQLTGFAAAGQPVTFTLVAEGTERRLSIDANNNGTLDGDEGVNLPPSLTSPGDQSTLTGTAVDLQIAASDPEGNALTFSAAGLPAGLSISTTGRVGGTTSTAGIYAVTVSVTDGANAAVTRSFTWTVSAPVAAAERELWKLDETSGTLAANADTARKGTHTGGVLVNQPGASTNTGRSAYYDGTDDATVLPPLNNTSRSVTLVMWVKRDGAQRGASQFLFCRDSNVTNDAGLGVGSDNNLRYHWAGNYWYFHGASELMLPDKEWAMAALVITPTSGTMFLRTATGQQSVTNYASHDLQDFAVPTHIANDPTRDGRRFKGWVDDVQFWRKALTISELEVLWLNATGSQRSSGLLGTYYRGMNFQDEAFQRIDPAINFNWGMGAPADGMWADTFSVRWTGCIVPAVTGNHTFSLLAETGCRMYVNGQLIINNWDSPRTGEVSGTAALTANTAVPVMVEYYNYLNNARCELSWSAPGLAKQIIPESRFLTNEFGTTTGGSGTGGGTVSASALQAIAALPEVEASLAMSVEAGIPQLRYTRPGGMTEQWSLEASPDLQDWSTLSNSLFSIQPQTNGRESILLPDARNVLSGLSNPPRLYFRVRAGTPQ